MADDWYLPLPDVDEVAGHGGGGGRGGADQVGAAALALAALEVTVAGRGAALARLQAVLIHGQAHGAAGFAPLHTGLLEDLVQPFPLGLSLHQARARHDHGLDGWRHAAACENARRRAQILDPRVGTRADEDAVDADV